ncbi:MAG: hypothetical protein ABI947_21785 [Chloroflexota bacterium]
MTRLSEIDWGNLGNPRILTLLQNVAAQDKEIRSKALDEIKDIIAPWELLYGYRSPEDLMHMAESAIPETIVPFIIELLKNEPTREKVYIIEILYDLSRYEYVDNYVIPSEKKDHYANWARRIRDEVYKGIDIYRTLLHSPSPEIQRAASDLIGILT